MNDHDPELGKQLHATLQTRKELGPEYEAELVQSFLEQVELHVDGVVEKRVRRQLAEQQMIVARGSSRPPQTPSSGIPVGLGARLGLAVASIVLAIPLSAIAAAYGGVTGLIVCWTGIVAVNAVQASRSWFPGRGHGRAGDPDDE
ncbi:hypothetical protein E0L36_00465 [Streptomyces sp. AJS327]|uniref:hypothetical protein n=1 Tax=Streptomyces sp. AJS327 TaxID=2545265 RepID=UPI0015DD8B54|nr:hypothetical protein [Streptomyces sp. AJS327]MBA0049438.1 hypothetical protein [Streptomyces sp. AJS327]